MNSINTDENILTAEQQEILNEAKELFQKYAQDAIGIEAAIIGSELNKSANTLQELLGKMSVADAAQLKNMSKYSCFLKFSGAAFGYAIPALTVSDALITDIKNNNPEESLKAAATLLIGFGLGGMITGVVGTGILATAMVGIIAVGISVYIDDNWENIKKYGIDYIVEDIAQGITPIIMRIESKLSPAAQELFNQYITPLLNKITESSPKSIDDMYQSIKETNPSKLDELANMIGADICPLNKNESLEQICKIVDTAEITPSPLIVDLDGDGVETTGIHENIYFDHDGNGFAEKSGWVGKDDGLLVRDINGNGQIDNGTELFGNNSVLSSGQKAENGFEALKDLDSNHDGVFDNKDAAWNEVKVWKDSNQNGLVEDGELLTLEQANVSGINLGYQDKDIVDENGNTIGQTGSFIKGDGSIGDISDIWFDADMADTADRTNVEIPAEIKALPNITGFGNVHNLQTAMALDASGELKALVEQFAAETDVAARREILINLIYHWTNVQDMDPRGRDPTQVYGPVLDDCRKLEALEEFMGKEFLGTWCWGDRDPNPHGKAAPYILKAFDELVNYVGSELLAQTHYKPLLENVTLTWNAETSSWSIDVSQAVNLLQEMYNANVQNGALAIIEFAKLIKKQNLDMTDDIISAFKAQGLVNEGSFADQLAIFGDILGTAGDDNLAGTARGDFISGENGNDTIYGNGGNDTLYGDNGNDTLWGEDGNDMLIGGAGDDYLNGGNGADTYFFEAGFGHDTIDNSDNNASADEPDIIQFGESIQPGMVTMSRDGFDLILTVKYAGTEQADDSVRILSYFDKAGTTSATPNNIIFADGTSWDLEYVYAHYNTTSGVNGGITIEGNNQNDKMEGTNSNDILIGNGGNDVIDGRWGNDILIGGLGDDYLDGSYGDDTYIYNLGDGLDTIVDYDGNDKIVFGAGISAENLTFRVEGEDLRIIINHDESQGIKLYRHFYETNSKYNKIENLYFADGKVLHLTDASLTFIQKETAENIVTTNNGDTVYANGGDDIVICGSGDDTVYGGAGNDRIQGNFGNDTLIGGTGDDYLNGSYGDDIYIYNLGDGLDTINDNQGNDKIIFGTGITMDNLKFTQDGEILRIRINNNENEGIDIERFFYGYDKNGRIETMEFADGSTLNLSDAEQLIQAMSSFGVSTSANMDSLYNPSPDIGEIYNITSSSDLIKKAV